MDKRHEKGYTAVLDDIDKNVLPLNCKFVMTDYEMALRNAYRAVIPDVKQHACHFHYAQTVHRYVKRNCPGLMKLIFSDAPENKEAHKTYKKLIYLPLLPAKDINEAFQQIALSTMSRYPKKFNIFLRYIKRQWLTRVSVHFKSILKKINIGINRIICIIRKEPKRFQFMESRIGHRVL